jgi:hypothetical protein
MRKFKKIKQKKTLLYLFEKIGEKKKKKTGWRSLFILILNFLFDKIKNKKPKWPSSIGRCRRSGNHPWEDLAKCGYKQDMKLKNFSHASFYYIFGYTPKTKYIEKIGEFNYFPPSLLAIENL